MEAGGSKVEGKQALDGNQGGKCGEKGKKKEKKEKKEKKIERVEKGSDGGQESRAERKPKKQSQTQSQSQSKASKPRKIIDSRDHVQPEASTSSHPTATRALPETPSPHPFNNSCDHCIWQTKDCMRRLEKGIGTAEEHRGQTRERKPKKQSQTQSQSQSMPPRKHSWKPHPHNLSTTPVTAASGKPRISQERSRRASLSGHASLVARQRWPAIYPSRPSDLGEQLRAPIQAREAPKAPSPGPSKGPTHPSAWATSKPLVTPSPSKKAKASVSKSRLKTPLVTQNAKIANDVEVTPSGSIKVYHPLAGPPPHSIPQASALELITIPINPLLDP
ncbi:hypothetical protein PAXRUDRAFT_20882 [Paxillus rubicundulus Ve08.2h10]|uniref:Uncharacterized protein n=1 Tax=Paxillus rubicundulus Ve08.2h10 TaxID=930991 RepID=A0A0D0D8K8_9AGAM|nr:hypothetical protein PAXRUDRAFT_20882 [Paxillus rubicundulus Ve08.2h10]